MCIGCFPLSNLIFGRAINPYLPTFPAIPLGE
jgi:hypothetical protein